MTGSEGTTGRALTFQLGSVPNAQMTVAACTSGCKAAGYTFAGVEFGGECCKWPPIPPERTTQSERRSVALALFRFNILFLHVQLADQLSIYPGMQTAASLSPMVLSLQQAAAQ